MTQYDKNMIIGRIKQLEDVIKNEEHNLEAECSSFRNKATRLENIDAYAHRLDVARAKWEGFIDGVCYGGGIEFSIECDGFHVEKIDWGDGDVWEG